MTLKVSRLLATSLEILVANTQFSLALATSWSQFRTLVSLARRRSTIVPLETNYIVHFYVVSFQ